MKIVCLIKNHPHAIYFANKINLKHKIDLVIIENEKSASVSFFRKIYVHFRMHFNQRMKVFKKKTKTYPSLRDILGDLCKEISSEINVIYTDDINSKKIEELLETTKPDLIIDHGTSILKESIFNKAKLALNLHWGLSPYYRGTHCTDWALINWDPYNIGVTIHKLSNKIDGGEILCQERVVPNENDRGKSINLRLTKSGTELLIKAITRIELGRKLKFYKQNTGLGFMTVNRQWSAKLQKQIEFIEENDLIKTMLIKPSRKEKLPIVSF